MSMSQGANLVEKAVGHGDNAVTEQDMTNPDRDRAKYGDPSETMKALAWMGKNDVQMSLYSSISSPFNLRSTPWLTVCLQSNVLSLKLSKTATLSSKSPAPLSAAQTYISYTAPSSKCKKAISLAMSSAAKSTAWDRASKV